MILGLSFGKKKESGTQDTSLVKNENVIGSQSQATSGAQSGTSSTSSSGTQTTTGTQTGSTSTNQTQNDLGTQKQTGTVTTLGADVSAGLADAVKQLLAGGVNDANIMNLSNMISGRSNFNADSMVADTVAAARNRGEQTLQEQNASIGSSIGGTSDTNSMAALLAQRGRNDLEANIAGITSTARAAAEGIANQNLAAAASGQGALVDQAATLGQTLKGGTTTTDLTTLTDQISQLLGTQNQTTANTSNTANNTVENTQTTQLIQELVNALTNQTTNTVGTENSKSTGKQSGGGVSLSL